jgi:hypothetical protein
MGSTSRHAPKQPRDRRPAGRARRPCPPKVREPQLVPPRCCPVPRDARRRRTFERRAAMAGQTAAGDQAAAMHAEARLAAQLLSADLALAERRADVLQCGLDCLDADIERARRRLLGPS